MQKSDFNAFHAILSDCLSVWSGPPNATIAAIWFRTLAAYDLGTLSTAFSAHMRDPQNGKFEPKPGHIVEQIERAAKNDGRPGPEEAWAISLGACDEADTVVWTLECVQAWAAATPIMALGDEVGARMAFKETYARLVAEARARFEAASWEVSEGFDKDRRRSAVGRAIEAGRIPAGKYAAIESITPLMLGNSAAMNGGIPAATRAKFDELREQWARVYEGPSDADAERDRLQELKRATEKKVEQFLKGGAL
ncbi:MAG: hypothetical protein WC829_02930 [Hyphomicrobium sp.]|jgi:hypothetical protein